MVAELSDRTTVLKRPLWLLEFYGKVVCIIDT